ncbi:flagellar protein FlaG [Candidatus Magnetomonas plexicatena]|uniref:flagellar protein FlaG n=1 Tax=Candidatus Magnetomonas plexicatena TaxID=2552947 RepID=UPI001C74C1C8|nr:flagellar protein FlaG [Nitrospirales bacterium LBB_01]
MDIKAYNTNIPGYSQPVQNTAETDGNRRQVPVADKTAATSGSAANQQDTSTSPNRGVLPDAQVKSTDKGISAVVRKIEDSAGKSKDKSSAIQQAAGKAYFAVDDNRNVVIKVEDSKGNVVSQIPPEEYIKMSKVLKEISSNLFHTTA